MADHTWMRHRVHGGTAQIANAAVQDWQELGWEPCDEPPPPPSPVLAEYQPLYTPAPAEPETDPTSMTEED